MYVGWDEGVVQMKLGEKALLDITSDFAYGARYVAIHLAVFCLLCWN